MRSIAETIPSGLTPPTLVASGNNRVAINAIWAVVARIVYVLAQLALIAMLAWMSDPYQVGTLILIFAVTGPVFMLTNLQLRVVLMTDTSGEFSVTSYRQLRLLTVVATFLFLCFVSTWIVDSFSAKLVFCMIALAKAVESVSDIHIGLLERDEQITTSSRSLMLRGVLAVTTFTGSYYLSHNLMLACASMAFAWFVVLLLHDLPAAKCLIPAGESLFKKTLHLSFDANEMASLVKKAWPLGLATMIMSLQANFPRLWTGHLFGFQALGIFGVLFQIAIAGQVLGNALCCPLLPRIAKLRVDKSRQHSYSVYATGIVALLGVCLGGLLLLVLQPLLQVTLGTQYASDVLLLRLVCVIVPVYFIQTALASVLRAKRRFMVILACEIGSMAILAGASFAIGKSLGLVGPAFAMFVSLLSSTAVYLAILTWDGINLVKSSDPLESARLRHRHAA